MDDKRRFEGTIKKVDSDGLVVDLNGEDIRFPSNDGSLKVGDKVYIRLFSESEEKMSKEEAAKALLNEVLNGEKE